jgi:hypothetical protein
VSAVADMCARRACEGIEVPDVAHIIKSMMCAAPATFTILETQISLSAQLRFAETPKIFFVRNSLAFLRLNEQSQQVVSQSSHQGRHRNGQKPGPHNLSCHTPTDS